MNLMKIIKERRGQEWHLVEKENKVELTKNIPFF